MANPLYGRFGGGPSMPGPIGNMANALNQYRQFKAGFRGDPRQAVQALLNSGQMSQEQFNQLSAMATQLQGMLR